MGEVVYSAQKTGFIKGRTYLNPRFFDGVLHPGATSVIIVGEWPAVERSYADAGIPVKVVDKGSKLPEINSAAGPDNVSQEVHSDHPKSTVIGKGKNVGDIDPPLKEGDNVEVPEGFEELSFRDLRALAAKFSDAPKDFSQKKDVVEFLSTKRPKTD